MSWFEVQKSDDGKRYHVRDTVCCYFVAKDIDFEKAEKLAKCCELLSVGSWGGFSKEAEHGRRYFKLLSRLGKKPCYTSFSQKLLKPTRR